MFKILFGDITQGRLARLPYFGYSLLLIAIMIAFMFGVVAAIAAGEHIIGGDLQQAQDWLRQHLGLPGMVVMGVVMLVIVYASLNLMAKRIRDIGLGGWWGVLVLVILGTVISALLSTQASQGFNLALWLALVLIPGNRFGASKQDAPP